MKKDKLKFIIRILFAGSIIILLTACKTPSAEVSPTRTDLPTLTSTATISPSPTPGPISTPTAIPPTAYPLPTADVNLDREPDLTVCGEGCDYTSLQSAINNIQQGSMTIIEIRDPEHTEAGILVDRDVIIKGLGTEETILQAHHALDGSPDRVILVEKGVTVSLMDMTIRHGDPAEENDKGGGIRNFGNLTIDNCLITDNQANGGGGINNSGDLHILHSTIQNNLADGIAPIGHECGNGGGIQSGGGKLFILNSTISGNQGGYRGRARGGGMFVGCSSEAVIINSTISQNRASRTGGREYGGGDSLGGGIFAYGNLQLIHVTITGNQASGGGAGVFVGRHMDYINTIISGNTGKGNCYLIDPPPEGVTELIGTSSYNLVTGGRCGADYQADPLLGPLEVIQGQIAVHPLLTGSPAIDLIPAMFCPYEFDQLSQLRVDSQDPGANFCDPGAVEYQP